MALSADRITDRKEGQIIAYPVKSATTIYKGALVYVDSTGYAVEGTSGGGRFVGVAVEGCVNPSGGALTVRVYKTGLFKFAKTGTITQANVGQELKLSDDQTVALLAASLTTNLTGATQNDLVYTAKGAFLGKKGELITIEYRNPGGTTATASVELAGTAIVAHLGLTTSAVDTTADALKVLLAAHAGIAAMVDVADAAANDGTGLLAAMAATPLIGGDYVGDLEALDGSAVWVRIDKAVA